MIPVSFGDLVYQHPDDRVTWDIDAQGDVLTRRVRPKGDGAELTVERVEGGVRVSNGLDGARYELTFGDGTRFQIRVTSIGIEQVTGPKDAPVVTLVRKIEKGKALAGGRSVDVSA